MKSTANAGLLSELHLKDCLSYVLSLPIHACGGCTTIGQIEDDVRIAQQFKPLAEPEVRGFAKRGRYGGPAPRGLEARHSAACVGL